MPFLFALVLIVFAGLLYLYVCVLVLIYLVLPLAVVGALAGVVGGLGAALVLACVVYAGRGSLTMVVGPAEVLAGAIGGPRQPPGRPRRDPAWPTYFAAQHRHDLGAAVAGSLALVGGRWRAGGRACGRVGRRVWWVAWPVVPVAVLFLVGLTVGAAVGVLVCTLVVAGATALAWLVGGAQVWILRAVDRGWQAVFRAAASCPRCYYLTTLPAYRCACADLHRDIRPGRLGVWWRRCGGDGGRCGRRLPTTVLRAARRMSAVCQRCGADLHAGAAVATDIRIPVFGATMAGKTRLIAAGLVLLQDAVGGRAAFTDGDSERTYLSHRQDFHGDRPMPKTAAVNPTATTLVLRSGRRQSLVHVFDAAGELLVQRAANAQLSYLDGARTMMFVLDPFAVPQVRSRLVGALAPVLVEANASPHDPEASYHATVQRLRDWGVDTRRRRLAFVISKADLLHRLPDDLGLRIGEPETWLRAHGLDNLLLSAGRDFGHVRVFVVSAVARPPGDVATALEPLRWLLAGEGIAV